MPTELPAVWMVFPCATNNLASFTELVAVCCVVTRISRRLATHVCMVVQCEYENQLQHLTTSASICDRQDKLPAL
jgi:hypothetical protein